MRKQKINRYELVHEISKVAKQMEQEDRLRSVDKKSSYIKTINDTEIKRNYVLEAHAQVTEKLKKKDDA